MGTPFTFDAVPGSLSNPIHSRDIDETNTQKSWIANLTIKQDFGPVEVTSSSSYYHRDVNLIDDTSKVIAYFFGTPTVEPVAMYGSYRNKEFHLAPAHIGRAGTKLVALHEPVELMRRRRRSARPARRSGKH